MNPARFNKVVRRELDRALREGVLDQADYQTLTSRYPVDRWDWHSLGRWFLLFGAISLFSGLVIIGQELFEFTLMKLAVVLGVVTVASFAAGWRLKPKGYLWSGRGSELVSGLSLIGLTFTLGAIYSTGSGNWPALLLIDLLILLPLAYWRSNPLLLILTMIVFFSWFGGMTGYISGWGAYWFGMNYPARFLLVGIAMTMLGFGHRYAEGGWLRGYADYFKIWVGSGLFFAEMALWLLSLFGNYGDIGSSYRETAAELWLFNLLWAGGNAFLLWLGNRIQQRQLRGFGLTFLTIQVYTLYFWHIAGEIGPVFGTLFAGIITLLVVIKLEKSRHKAS